MKRIKLPNGNSMEFYEYSITNACIVRFVDTDYQVVKEFFGKSVISSIIITDENGNFQEEKELGMKRSKIYVEDGTIQETEKKLVSEAYDEEVTSDVLDDDGNPILDSDGNPETKTEIIHHEAVYEDVVKNISVEFTVVVLEKPTFEEQVEEVKNYVGIVDEETLDLNGWKSHKQEENKLKLSTFLQNAYVLFNGKQYGVSEEDQNELSLNYLQYQMSVQAGQEAILEWHAKHEECVPFTETEYATLVLMIKTFVYPFVSKMQSYKAQIYACATIEDVKSMQIEYSIEDGIVSNVEGV